MRFHHFQNKRILENKQESKNYFYKKSYLYNQQSSQIPMSHHLSLEQQTSLGSLGQVSLLEIQDQDEMPSTSGGQQLQLLSHHDNHENEKGMPRANQQ